MSPINHDTEMSLKVLSLNGFEDATIWLLSKAECILSNRTKICWDINFSDVIMNFPWKNGDSGSLIMHLSEDILSALELMEKESDVDDILSYRSIVEREMQESLLTLASSTLVQLVPLVLLRSSKNDESSLGRSRRWLNWISPGMLCAGEAEDSSQFLGVVSDGVIKDIYEV
ncbi:hypothetical protein NE237_027767 [Protea cynaroides]|uniref:Uncharacterized protein n=1 Tax=Protea cynaroides TaxID=273540 RepID=A0A9Q0GR46_9MAGN|nr:hypothetical protein NE237_027767 [Protea cynaroides]